MKIAHIINPVSVTEKSDLFVAQPVTFETMRRAKGFAMLPNSSLDIELFYTCFESDIDFSPSDFNEARLLSRSIQDIGVFNVNRELPLLRDILDSIYESTDSDYIVYTNVDISLTPYFYTTVARIIENGCDAFVINRRTISDVYNDILDIPLMYSDIGESHPGFDCFVFKRSAYPSYILNDICIGINWVGTALLWNLQVFSDRFKVFEESHLTFHIGNDKKWKSPDFEDYVLHNRNEAKKTYLKLQEYDNGFSDERHWRFLCD